MVHSVLGPQPHENAVLIQLDEHYSIRSSPPGDREQKPPRGPCWYPNIAPNGQHPKKQVSEGLKYRLSQRTNAKKLCEEENVQLPEADRLSVVYIDAVP